VNAVLISWFWSLMSERFDPRSARRAMRRMVAGAALGGLLGGLLVERAAGAIGGRTMLLALAVLHLACAVAVWRLSSAATDPARDAPAPSGFAVLRRSRYAQKLALLVVLSTVTATVLDYLFKAAAVATFAGGPELLRFFALFYAATGVLTFLFQTLLGHLALARLGIAGTAAALPATVALGGALALFLPGLPAFAALRGGEMSLHSSLYRSGYELFFTPMSPSDKRGLKTLIDVGFERVGDALGGGLVKLFLAVAGAALTSALLGVAVGLSLAMLLLAVQLHRGYVATLEQRLRERAVDIDVTGLVDRTTMSVLMSVGVPAMVPPPVAPIPAPDAPPADPVAGRIADLRSGDIERVRRALANGPLPAPVLPHAIALLAWDEAAPAALAALSPYADPAAGQLADALLSPDEEFAVRRRLPRVLAAGSSPRVIAALTAALDDARFEVRYRSGRALAHIHARAPEAAIDRERILAAVLREASIDRGVWQSQRLLDEELPDGGGGGGGGGPDPFIDELVRDRASRSLEHVFTLLSLAFPRRPLVLAFRGLHTSDEHLRGTALEYLDGLLPSEVRVALWPFLEDGRPARRRTRSREQALEELLRSNQSIQLNLEEARRRLDAGAG
jgi:ATP:ADP antiporter, AAA family